MNNNAFNKIIVKECGEFDNVKNLNFIGLIVKNKPKIKIVDSKMILEFNHDYDNTKMNIPKRYDENIR